MSFHRHLQKSNTIFSKTFRPVIGILFIFIAIFTILLQQNLLSYLKINASAVFEERVVNRKLYVENEMNNRWTAIDSSVAQIVEQLEHSIVERGASLSDIAHDFALNQHLLATVMNDIIGVLRTSGTTEVFLMLDGNAVEMEDSAHLKAGVYIRNNNPESYSSNHSDLLFERGLPMLSNRWKIPLDSYWQSTFDMDQTNYDNIQFITKPLNAAKNSENKEFSNFGYWCFSQPISPQDGGVLTYSVPLIASDGSVIGVMGVGVREEYFAQNINYQELDNNRTGAYILARTTDNQHYQPIIFNGSYYNKSTFIHSLYEVKDNLDSSMQLLFEVGEKESDISVKVQPLELYNFNTPFFHEQWVLMGIVQRDDLLSTYHNAVGTLFMLAAIGIFLCTVGIFGASQVITSPIRRLIDELRSSNPNKPIHLQRINLEEIDELSISIENLSASVATAFSKISSMIQMSESGIAVFEYKEKENLVFFTKSLYDLFGWPEPAETEGFTDATDFRHKMEGIENYRVSGEEDLFEVTLANGKHRWLRFNQTFEEGSTIGVVTDISNTIMEKRQIEFERDYDLLTGLFNRRAFEERAMYMFEYSDLLRSAAILVWDLDNLKYVNDHYGHTVGDNYIIALANCLKAFETSAMFSARRSGDEFVTLIYGYNKREDIEKIIERLWEAVQQTEITLPNNKTYRVRVSVGVAWYATDADNYADLFQYADFAMYTAKHRRKGTMAYFDLSVYQDNKVLLQGQEDFNKLLDNRLVRYRLQPIVSVWDGAIYGYEMLMSSELELFRSPADILKMAHAQSKLHDIEAMTWFESMKIFVQMSESGVLENGKKVFINSIASEFLQSDMITLFEKSFRRYLPQIVCEFTEEEQRDSVLTEQKTQLMREWNAMTAIDDYGCGYNGEAILLEISPDIVKIDMTVIRGIDRDQSRRHLANNLIQYAHQRNIMVLAEGVETDEELKTLMELEVDLLQGYYIAKPSFEGIPPTQHVLQQIGEYYRQYKKS